MKDIQTEKSSHCMIEYYKKSISLMLVEINNEHFLRQIWIILKCHIKRKGGALWVNTRTSQMLHWFKYYVILWFRWKVRWQCNNINITRQQTIILLPSALFLYFTLLLNKQFYIPNKSAWVPILTRYNSLLFIRYISSQSGIIWHSLYPT